MLFRKNLFRTCHYIPVKNKPANHLYIAILHISVLCLTVFEIILTTPLHMHAWSCQIMCCFNIGMSAVDAVAEKPRFRLYTCERARLPEVQL